MANWTFLLLYVETSFSLFPMTGILLHSLVVSKGHFTTVLKRMLYSFAHYMDKVRSTVSANHQPLSSLRLTGRMILILK